MSSSVHHYSLDPCLTVLYALTPHTHTYTVPQDTLERLRETFRRLSTASGYLPQATFLRDVLGESVPSKLADVS